MKKNEKKQIKEKKSNKGTLSKKKKMTQEKVKRDNNFSQIKKYLTKTNITYFILILLDIILVIYSARKNIVNYITILDEEIFVSKTRYLFLGRNYINLIITAFFYIYICIVNKFMLKNKNTKKFLIILFFTLLVLNLLLFFLFTKRVY